MAKKTVPLTFTFVDPNTPKLFQQLLQRILTDRLLSNPPYPLPERNSP